ncbi:uncharacterized protein DUF2029 [Compostimonas suwonensis]|uniref:Uncharacterized protein DUF2029 n=2 Tax=Compostimonas suwonensis TaxID=1048394 RepID=A0A2M9BUP1_9MICO|nr:uncharacterized protein DUF2029 [Compostimonas suwonensis]
MVSLFGGSTLLWLGFAFVHVILLGLSLYGQGWPLGDVVLVYKTWSEHAAAGAQLVGIDSPWVYPILAFPFMYASLAFGSDAYQYTWLGLVILLNAGAFAMLIGSTATRRPRVTVAAWWWLGFLLLLGPIAMTRIDAVTVALSIVGLLWLSTRPLWGTAVLTIATWVKVWPAALVAALIMAGKGRWRLLAAAAGTSAVIVLICLVLGSGMNVFSFITEQTGRGLQIEAPVSTPWMWQAVFHVPGSFVYYDRDILTFQVAGAGVDVVGAIMTPLLALAVAAVLVLAVLAVRRGVVFTRLFPSLSLALVLAFIAFNKVGSPQFIAWLAAPIIIGIVYHGRAYRTPAILAAVLAALTQLVYPYLYYLILAVNPVMVAVLGVRNVLEFVLLGWAVWSIATSRAPEPVVSADGADAVGAVGADDADDREDAPHPLDVGPESVPAARNESLVATEPEQGPGATLVDER